MEALRRMFYLRDSVRGAKIPIVLAVDIVGVGLLVVFFFIFETFPRPLTLTLVIAALWAVAAIVLNNLRKDPYYSFELVPTQALIILVVTLIVLLCVENAPEMTESDLFAEASAQMASGIASAAAPLIIFIFLVYFYVVCAAGSAIALLFSSKKIDASGWTSEMRKDLGQFYDAAKGPAAPGASPARPVAPSGQPAPPAAGVAGQRPAAAESAPVLNAGQIAKREFWQRATGGDYIYCRQCGAKLVIWGEMDFCPRCGRQIGVSEPEVQCIDDAMCGTKIGKTDRFCFRCGGEQPAEATSAPGVAPDAG